VRSLNHDSFRHCEYLYGDPSALARVSLVLVSVLNNSMSWLARILRLGRQERSATQW